MAEPTDRSPPGSQARRRPVGRVARPVADVSPTTRKTYATSWADFTAWCAAREVTPLPVDLAAAAAWLNARARAGRSRPSLLVDRAALAARQREAGYPWQPDERVARAIARGRVRGRRPPPSAAALR
ncbi:hypothetical protein HLH33_15695, partial [Gluconacetobacter diazotrophicus]|nr:hypothetical protein [Gluconacetobacter diazotrophicus]